MNVQSTKESPFFNYKAGDTVIAVEDFNDMGNFGIIPKGTTDTVESVSSNHHGGLQLNLIKHGRGWSNNVWRHPLRIKD